MCGNLLKYKMFPSEKLKMILFIFAYLPLPLFIHAASISARDDSCPVNNNQCSCSEGSFFAINCKNISNVNVLQEVVQTFTHNTFIFELDSVQWTSFPLQALENPFLRTMVIGNSTFDHLFHTNLLTSPQETSFLNHLSLENVTINQDWSWNQLKVLKKLDIFFLYNTTIGEMIPADFGQHVSKNLKFLSISQSNISHIEPESLTNLKNLTYLKISHSKLRTLTRNILPSPTRLGQLLLE